MQPQRNMPSELGKLNEVFAQHDVNIGIQHNQTDGQIGYVVLDTDGVRTDAEYIIRDIRRLSGTIRARALNQSS
jgi:D-3-phosphoglycerate dehydrogenase